MPRNSTGQYTPPEGVIVTSGQTILPQQHNPFITDAGQAISDSLSRDGRGGMRNNLDMGGFRVSNVAAGVNASDVATVGQIQAQTGVPVGAMFLWATATAPQGYLSCMGQSLSRAQYPALFTILGTTYGAINGQSFNLPDLRGRTPAGLDTQQGGTYADRLTSVDSRAIGAAGGVQNVTLTAGQMPKHDHDVTIEQGGAHSHTMALYRTTDEQNISFPSASRQPQVGSYTTPSGGAHTHTLTEQERGNNEAHTNVQPTIIMNYIIKAF